MIFIKKYSMFLKYIGVAIISFIIDISCFKLFNVLLNNRIIIATIFARIISSFVNFLLNKEKVFKSDENKYKTLINYYILVLVQMLISAFLVDNLFNLIKIDATIIKIPVEFLLFICNYFVQKYLIFKKV